MLRNRLSSRKAFVFLVMPLIVAVVVLANVSRRDVAGLVVRKPTSLWTLEVAAEVSFERVDTTAG